MKLNSEELRRVVRFAQKGDRGAAAQLFDHYHPRVYRYALSKLRNTQEAEDAAAETFAKILRELPKFRWRGAGFEAWLFRIASNVAMDILRHRGRQTGGDEVVAGALGAVLRTPEHDALEHELARELGSMVERLSPDQKEVVVLRFAAGLTSDEIAHVMGRKTNAVRQLQFRALASLRQMIQEKEGAA